jgi:hypothetical protein
MLAYFLLVPFVLLFLHYSYSKKNSRSPKYFPVFISALILIGFAGLRSGDVGTDTNNYIGIYKAFVKDSKSIFEMETSIELGYLFLQELTSLFSKEYWAILVSTAVLSVLPYYYIINKLSKNVILSVFIYITLAIYLIFFNAGRQGIASAIASISVIYLIERSIIKYVICIIIASLFHTTALIMLPFYFILNRKVTFNNILIYTVIGVISFSFLSSFLSLFSSGIEERYAVYENRGAAGGNLLALFFICLGIYLFILREKISVKNLKLFDVYFNYCIFTSIIYIVVIYTQADVNFIRITNYFALGFILIWPIVFEDVKFFKYYFVKILFILIHLLFYGIYINKMSALSPYSLNSNLL